MEKSKGEKEDNNYLSSRGMSEEINLLYPSHPFPAFKRN